MPRTKPSQARSKIFEAEQLRLRLERHNPEFKRDLEELEAIAKRLHGTSQLSSLSKEKLKLGEQVKVAEGVVIPKDLLPTPDEEAFHELAERFKEKWNFQPYWGEDGRVILFVRMPAGGLRILNTGEVIETTRRGKYHSDTDVDALAKYFRDLREQARLRKGRKSTRHRKRPDTAALKVIARELAEQGKTVPQIAEALFPREYRTALTQDEKSREKLGSLISKYINPPHNMHQTEAEKRAARELGLDVRPSSIKLQKLTHRVRRYLGKLDG